MKNTILEILACPDCKSKVRYNDKERYMECFNCKRKFLFSGNVPVLFSKLSRNVISSGKNFYDQRDIPSNEITVKRFARKIEKLSNVSVGETLHVKLRNEYILNSPRKSLILNLGSGIDNILMKENIINFDISPHPNTDISGDGHYLPFLSGSFDGVWLCAVLEHLENPSQGAAEIYRVLKPGGFVLAGAPFMYHLHGSPHDYFRYTDSGLRAVFKEFKEVECGPTHTLPTGTLIEIFSQYCSIYFDNKKLSAGIRILTKLMLSPLKFLDFYLKKKSKSSMLSGGFVFFGKKE